MKSLIFLALCCVGTTAGAAIYKWTDDNGNIQFSQYPPAGVEAEYIQPPPDIEPAGDRDEALYSTLEQLEQSSTRREQQSAEETQKRQLASERQQACEQARQNLATLQLGGHRRIRMPDGTASYLDADQKQRYIDISKQNIRDNCD